MIDDNAVVAADSANTGIKHTYTPDTVGPGTAPKTPEYVIAITDVTITDTMINREYGIGIEEVYMTW